MRPGTGAALNPTCTTCFVHIKSPERVKTPWDCLSKLHLSNVSEKAFETANLVQVCIRCVFWVNDHLCASINSLT